MEAFREKEVWIRKVEELKATEPRSLLIGSGSGILGCVFVYSYILPTLYLVRILATCGHGPRVPSSSNAGDK